MPYLQQDNASYIELDSSPPPYSYFAQGHDLIKPFVAPTFYSPVYYPPFERTGIVRLRHAVANALWRLSQWVDA